jgi:hypothetical protein
VLIVARALYKNRWSFPSIHSGDLRSMHPADLAAHSKSPPGTSSVELRVWGPGDYKTTRSPPPSGSHRSPAAPMRPREREALSPPPPPPPLHTPPQPLAPQGTPKSPALDPPSPPTAPSPSSPPTSSGFPVLFCRLHFTATSGVCLFPQAPLVFSFKKTTFAHKKLPFANKNESPLHTAPRLALESCLSTKAYTLYDHPLLYLTPPESYPRALQLAAVSLALRPPPRAPRGPRRPCRMHSGRGQQHWLSQAAPTRDAGVSPTCLCHQRPA